ncbi:flagellar motor protein MotB [Pseudogemmobacter faecipullorum]|uniref:Flagellar motor protein MotB n=1 Tax=Pseudogemmobacter faecipullorum TaxID=2755041 RepID=A0ABS8CJ48_9RHOB|nr:flagellar motor protein MotB [Pseudogemmobacter faecipullorum]
MATPGNSTIIVKRKRKLSPAAQHGGAWKVAYADFVTAMMAFFLLMWLMNATTEKQRKGLSDYFNPSIPINRVSGGGEDTLDGASLFAEEQRAHNGYGGTAHERGGAGVANAGEEGENGQAELVKKVEQALFERGGESRTMQQMLRHVVTRVTDEGLVIELFDLPDATLFQEDTAHPQPVTIALAQMLAEVLGIVSNQVAVNGHLRRYPLPMALPPGWDLSSARAGMMRGLLQSAGLAELRFQRVTGFADRRPVALDPTVQRNNRIEIVLLRHDR